MVWSKGVEEHERMSDSQERKSVCGRMWLKKDGERERMGLVSKSGRVRAEESGQKEWNSENEWVCSQRAEERERKSLVQRS